MFVVVISLTSLKSLMPWTITDRLVSVMSAGEVVPVSG